MGGAGAAFQFRQDAAGQGLAQLHAPLIEAVDAPHHPLDQGFVLVERDQGAQGVRRQGVHHDQGRGTVAGEGALGRQGVDLWFTATAQRLATLSERVSRTSALLRTRVDIATEQQNQQLLAKLTRGQEIQLHLQTTVEGLSIAAISYYVISLLLYGAKAIKAAGVPVNPELAAGVLIPLVLWGVWSATQRIHKSVVKLTHKD